MYIKNPRLSYDYKKVDDRVWGWELGIVLLGIAFIITRLIFTVL